MRTTSARWKEAIPGVTRWVNEIRWTNEGITGWSDPLDLVSGTVTSDATNQVRWSCDLTLSGAPVNLGSDDPTAAFRLPDGINPYTSRLMIKTGIAYSDNPNDVELLGMGIYKVMEVSVDSEDPTIATVTGDGKERYLIDARYSRPWRAKKNHARARLDQLVLDVLPSTDIFWDGVNGDRLLPSLLVEKERWDLIYSGTGSGSIARAVGAQIYFDGDGTLIVRPTPALTDDPVWSAEAGENGVLVSSGLNLSNESVYNVVTVTGESTDTDAAPVGPISAEDTDPDSPTYTGRSADDGGFGPKPYFYSSQLITSADQALTTAQSLLAERLGLRKQVSFNALHDPSIEPGDVGIVTAPDGTRERVIIDSITYDLLGGTMEGQTRTTATRLAGTDTDLPDDDEGGEA